MKVDGRHFRSIWLEPDGFTVGAIDQRRLPHEFIVARLTNATDAADAIRSMLVRGAPLIGATAAYGVALAMRSDNSDAALDQACKLLIATRPTAINLKWALDEMARLLRPLPPSARADAAYARAREIAEEDVAINRDIGRHGLELIKAIAATKKPGEPVNVLTHCNANLHGARPRHARPCLGRRDPAAQPGCEPHRLGAAAARRATHGDIRQRRRAPDAAR